MANINWDFISELEGKGVKKAYVPSENSGVTVATGFDLKEKDVNMLSEMGISEDTTNILSQFFGMSGADAEEASKGFELNDEQVKEIDQASHNWYSDQVIKTYNSHNPVKPFEELTPAQQTVLTSVGFQHGTGFKRKDGSDMNFIKQAASGDWNAVLNNLRNFGDQFPTRRNKEADLLESEKKIPLDKEGTHQMPDGTIMENTAQEAEEKRKFTPIDITKQKYLWSEEPDVSRGLFLDQAYNASELQKFIEEGRTVPEILKATIQENTIFANAWELFATPTFMQQDGFSWDNNKEEFDAVIKQYNLNDEFADSLVGALNSDHLKYLAEKASNHQKNTELLASLCWKGIALQFGTFILDPVNLLGYGALNKVMKGGQFLTGLTRRQEFLKKGLAYGTLEGALYSPIVANNPTMGLNDVLIASALGGTLGGGISALTAKHLKNVARATQKQDLIENGLKPTDKANKTIFKNTKHSLENKKLINDLNDTSLIDNVELFFPKLRNLPFAFGLFSANRSGTLGSSISKKVRLFNFKSLEEPVGYKDVKTGKAAVQDTTVEMARDQVVMQAHSTVYTNVGDAMKGYLKARGYGSVKGFFQFGLKTQFMHDTKRVIIALSRQEKKFKLSAGEQALLRDPHLVKAANAYADGFQLWAKLLKEAGVEGAEDLAQDTGRFYVPRKISLESFQQLEKRLGEEGVEDLITQAIANQQPLLNRLDNPIAKAEKAKVKTPDGNKQISITKARALARVIVKAAKYNSRMGGFDIEQLIRIKNPEMLREYIDDVFSNLTPEQRDTLFDGLKNQISVLTSGRFKQRIRLNENFETTINGQKVRLDELFENDVDLLWHSYTNEMAGWYSLSDRLGIKSRNEWLKYKNELFNDIDTSYRDPDSIAEFKKLKNKAQRIAGGRFIAQEEKDTIDSFFNNLMGRSTESGDPTVGVNKWLANLRRFNFIRVLNQVGVAQLPEYGVATSQQGFRVLLNEIPAFRKLFSDAQAGKIEDTFYKDLAVIGSSNGDDFIFRQFQAIDVLDRGVSQLDTSARGKYGKAVTNTLEKGTGHASGLIHIDRNQRRIAMRLFVHRLAEDLIDVSKSGKFIDEISKGRLNRYRVLGLSDQDLIALAKEFNSPNVVTEVTGLGRRVLQFDFVNFKDQNLVKKFGIAVNRYTKRAVQYNMIGDTNRFFSDSKWGKTMSQFRQFIMTAWSKQFLHNVAMGDFQTFSMFMYTSLIGGASYIAQSNFNTIGMSATEKKAYLKKKFGNQGDYTKIALASFQRAGWSSVMPPFMDMILGQVAPEYRFNTRSSGQEMNLITGNPTYDLGEKTFSIAGSFLKTMFNSDYNFSKQDLNRIMRMLPYQNLYGINQLLNYIRDNSGLPDQGTRSLY